MPIYVYSCKECGVEEFEVLQSFKDKPKKKCPNCSKNALYRVIQPVFGTVKKSDSELKTVGDLAHRNRDKFSDDKKESVNLKKKQIKKPQKPSWLESKQNLQKLAKKTEKEKNEYVRTGRID